MANPLQPNIIKMLETEFEALVINVVGSSKSGMPDLIACIQGQFFGFEIKWKNDRPSELQKTKINSIIDAGGRAYFIRSTEQLRFILNQGLEPERYTLKNKFKL